MTKTRFMTGWTAALALITVSSTAEAVWRPEWDRPVQAADMEVLHSSGVYDGAEKVTLFERLRARDDRRSFRLTIDGASEVLLVREVRSAGCGSVAIELYPERELRSLVRDTTKVVLFDHSRRLCEDYRPYRWELSIERIVHGKRELGELYSGGNPEPVYTAQ